MSSNSQPFPLHHAIPACQDSPVTPQVRQCRYRQLQGRCTAAVDRPVRGLALLEVSRPPVASRNESHADGVDVALAGGEFGRSPNQPSFHFGDDIAIPLRYQAAVAGSSVLPLRRRTLADDSA